jgi:hypothetical protein
VTTADDHRRAAETALERAQRNPIMSTEQFFAVAQINALLAIERRLADFLAAPTTLR